MAAAQGAAALGPFVQMPRGLEAVDGGMNLARFPGIDPRGEFDQDAGASPEAFSVRASLSARRSSSAP